MVAEHGAEVLDRRVALIGDAGQRAAQVVSGRVDRSPCAYRYEELVDIKSARSYGDRTCLSALVGGFGQNHHRITRCGFTASGREPTTDE